MSYIPRHGSHSQTTKTDMPEMVRRTLQPLMEGSKPTATICLAMQKKIDAEEILRTHIKNHKMIRPSPTTRPAKTRTKASTRSSSPATSWDEVHPTKPTDNMEEMISHLTQEERNHILHTIHSCMMDVSHSEEMQSKMSAIERGRRGPVDRGPTSTSTSRPLTCPNATKLMFMGASLTLAMASQVSQLCTDDQDGVWEIACAPHSWLSEACEQHGLQPRRINLDAGYDIYKADTWERLKVLQRRHRPRRLCFSLPCTKWCRWTSVNYNTPERRELLESHRRRERRMLWQVVNFLKFTLEEYAQTLIYFEWTHPCQGWSQNPMVDLSEYFHKHDIPWLDCQVDGCNYGMKDQSGEFFLHKKWLIKTNGENFHKEFRAIPAPRYVQEVTPTPTSKVKKPAKPPTADGSVHCPLLAETTHLQPQSSFALARQPG